MIFRVWIRVWQSPMGASPPETDNMQMSEPSAVGLLAWRARYKALAARMDAARAEAQLVAWRVPEPVRRAAVGAAGSLGQIVEIGAWSNSAQTVSSFYRMLNDNAFVQIPAHVRVGMMTSSPAAGVVGEGKAVPVSQVVIGNIVLLPTRVGSLIVCTDSLLFDVSAPGQAMFNRELLSRLGAAVDAAFVAKISSGLTPITSTAALADVRAAMLAVASDAAERPYFIASTDVGKLAATLSDVKGGPAFAAASSIGGELCNLPLLVSSGLAAGTLYYVNAAQIVANGEAPTINVSSEADIQMDTAPGSASDLPTAASLVSMFTTNSTALRSTVLFACDKLRANAVSVVTGITATTWAS